MTTPIDHRGEGNYFRNAVLNTIEVLKKFPAEDKQRIRNYYEEDVLNPITPCFCVIVNGSKDEMRASQNLTRQRYTIHINLDIWYYHSDLTEETKRNRITYTLWEISDLIKRNMTLNEFVPHLGAEIQGVRWAPQPRPSRILAGGVINVLAKKLYSCDVVH